FSQTEKVTKNQYVQLSGVVVEGEGDSLIGVPFVSIYRGTKAVTVTDYYGFFTLVAKPGDEIHFSSVDHRQGIYQLDDTLSAKHFYIIQRLVKDTVMLANIDVYPWPSKEDFKKAFLNLNLSETDYDRAYKNLDKEQLSYGERNLRMDAQANYKYAMQQYLTKVYTAGQYPTISLLNPIAWAQFIDAWRKGKFKKKAPAKYR
ncbi:MAG TPA: hypothetical protein VN026_18065, partial [Bacteroidia bacterium]|nr:hypothetical protein [Bacteroidia bacterium]